MSDEVDALYEIARTIQKGFEDIDHRLSVIVGQLEDLNGNLDEAVKSLPNPLDVPE